MLTNKQHVCSIAIQGQCQTKATDPLQLKSNGHVEWLFHLKNARGGSFRPCTAKVNGEEAGTCPNTD